MSGDISPNSHSVGDYYDRVIDETCRLLGGQWGQFHVGFFDKRDDILPKAQLRLNDRLAQAMNLRRGARVVDVGCGIAGPACYLASKYDWDITGVTISQVQSWQAADVITESGCSERVRVIVGDAHDLPLENERFDAVYGIESFAHFSDKFKVIGECARLTRTGGILGIWDLVACSREVSRAFELLHLITIKEYKEICQQHGFEIISADDFGQAILPRSMDAFIEMLDPVANSTTIRTCHEINDKFRTGEVGYALIVTRRLGAASA
jgi:cyclopropane fatty-acyl-phospholipid synthase-like methyltransferase